MAITTPGTWVKLNVNAPKKDAIIGSGAFSVGADDVIIIAAANAPNVQLTQFIVGTFIVCENYVLDNLPNAAVVTSCPVGGGIADVVTGTGLDSDTHVGVILGNNLIQKQQSHFINRTFTRLIEVWLEGTT